MYIFLHPRYVFVLETMMRRLNWCGSVITLLMENVSTITDVQYVIKNIIPTNQAHTLKYTSFQFFFISSHPAALQTIEDKQTRSGKPWLTQNLSSFLKSLCQIFWQILAVVVQTNSVKYLRPHKSQFWIKCLHPLRVQLTWLKKWQVLNFLNSELSFANYCKDLKSFTSQLSVRLWYSLVIKI